MGKSRPDNRARLLGQIRDAKKGTPAPAPRKLTPEEQDAALEAIPRPQGQFTVVDAAPQETSSQPVTGLQAATVGGDTGAQPVTGQRQVTGQNDQRSPAQPVTRTQPVTGGEPVETAVKQRKGFLLIPNAIVWDLLPQLDIYERGVYEELYLWTHGFGENPRRVNQAECYKRLRISERQWRRAVEELEKRGLVERLAAEVRGPNSSRGTLIRVNVPAGAASEQTGQKLVTGGKQVTGRTPVHESKKKVEEKGPASAVAPPADLSSILRTEAEEYRTKHPQAGELVIRERLREHMRGKGWRVDEQAIDAAMSE